MPLYAGDILAPVINTVRGRRPRGRHRPDDPRRPVGRLRRRPAPRPASRCRTARPDFSGALASLRKEPTVVCGHPTVGSSPQGEEHEEARPRPRGDLAVALAAVPGAVARPDGATADPGVTSKSITIGATLPLSGPASLYARIGTGMRAYFSYINARRARDGKRGVYGRQIVLKVYDDQYQEAQTVQQTRRAVEQDRVFAIVGGLGTENQQAVRAYMNQRKVPQLYVSTGLSEFGRLYRQNRVDDRLAAGLRPGGHPPRALRPPESAEREGRGAAAERRLRQGAPPGLPELRRSRSRRRHGDLPARRRRRRHRRPHGSPARLGRRHVPDHRDADRDDHGARGRLPPRLAAEQARQLGRRDRHVHDGRPHPPARRTRSRASSTTGTSRT